MILCLQEEMWEIIQKKHEKTQSTRCRQKRADQPMSLIDQILADGQANIVEDSVSESMELSDSCEQQDLESGLQNVRITRTKLQSPQSTMQQELQQYTDMEVDDDVDTDTSPVNLHLAPLRPGPSSSPRPHQASHSDTDASPRPRQASHSDTEASHRPHQAHSDTDDDEQFFSQEVCESLDMFASRSAACSSLLPTTSTPDKPKLFHVRTQPDHPSPLKKKKTVPGF